MMIGPCNHISGISEKARKKLNILNFLKHTVERETLVNIYMAFIRPILE